MIQRVDSTYRGKPTHHYRIDGTRVDGVTTLISNGVPKPALLHACDLHRKVAMSVAVSQGRSIRLSRIKIDGAA